MPCTVNANFRSVVHAGSNGICNAFPDVCKTPVPPVGPIPIPYPNIAMSSDLAQGTTQVKVDGNPACIQGSNFSQSTGDEAGQAGGLVSSCTKGKAEPMLYSFDVQFEGKGVVRLADIFVQNKGGGPNTPPFPIVQPPVIILPSLPPPDEQEDAQDWDLDQLTAAEDPDAPLPAETLP